MMCVRVCVCGGLGMEGEEAKPHVLCEGERQGRPSSLTGGREERQQKKHIIKYVRIVCFLLTLIVAIRRRQKWIREKPPFNACVEAKKYKKKKKKKKKPAYIGKFTKIKHILLFF